LSAFKVQPNVEEIVLPGLDTAEIEELREWFCNTKPLGRSVRIIASHASGGPDFGVVAAGNEWGPAEEPDTRGLKN
jgi:hypothetical protein